MKPFNLVIAYFINGGQFKMLVDASYFDKQLINKLIILNFVINNI